MDPVAGLRAELDTELRRVVDRLRGMPERRLLAGPAARAREVAQGLADAAADLTGDRRRPVPVLDPFAAGDQVAVTGQDLLAALDAVRDRPPGGTPDDAADAALRALRSVQDLRSRL